jgi:hypothetical protein
MGSQIVEVHVAAAGCVVQAAVAVFLDKDYGGLHRLVSMLLCTRMQEYLDTSPLGSYILLDAAMQQSEAIYGSGNKA